MHEPLEELTVRVAQSAERLKHHYGAKRLHILRVGIRRIRTYLKQSGNLRAKRMRKIWGGFAGATNDARDWDVFHRTARVLLEPDEYQAFKRLNRKWLEASHRAVDAPKRGLSPPKRFRTEAYRSRGSRMVWIIFARGNSFNTVSI